MTSSAPIGVLDSGVGGLSLLPALRTQLPQENLHYVADSGHAPYGDRCASWITERSARIIQFLERQGCKAVVIACNTITAVAVSALRQRFEIPIIAIEPAIKPAVAMSRSRVIAVLATTRTLTARACDNCVSAMAMTAAYCSFPAPVWLTMSKMATCTHPVCGPACATCWQCPSNRAQTHWCWAAPITRS